MSNIHISLAAEPIFTILNFSFTNSLIVTYIVSFIIILFSLWFKKETKKAKPSNAYILIYSFFSGLLSFFESVAGEKAFKFFPLLASFFIFILISNWSGLLPGVGSIGIYEIKNSQKILIPFFRGPTADINTTLALALISVSAIQYYGIKSLGLFGYLKKFFDFTSPLNFYVGFLEIISDISKILSFCFRLFGNIFAGEVLLTVMASLIPIIVPLPFIGLELFVGLVQALVFTMLSLVFITTATVSHNNNNH